LHVPFGQLGHDGFGLVQNRSPADEIATLLDGLALDKVDGACSCPLKTARWAVKVARSLKDARRRGESD